MKTLVASQLGNSLANQTLIVSLLGAFLLFLNAIGLHNSLTDGGYITWQGVIISTIGLGVALSFLLSPLLKRTSAYSGTVLGTIFLVTIVLYNIHNPFLLAYSLAYALILYLFPGLLLLYTTRTHHAHPRRA